MGRITRMMSGMVVVALGATAVAGCGSSSDSGSAKTAEAARQSDARQAVVQVMFDLQAASRAGDGKRICAEIFTPKLATAVTKASKSGSCAKEAKGKLFSKRARITVQKVDVTAASEATAMITERGGNASAVSLVKQSGRWRIRGVHSA